MYGSTPMTLKQLAARLNTIVAQNERAGWSERNDLPVVVQINRKSSKGNLLKSHYAQVGSVDSCHYGLHDGLKFHGQEPEWDDGGRAAFCGTLNVLGYGK